MAGNKSKGIVSVPNKKNAFSGKSLVPDTNIEVYFCQKTENNSTLDKNPTLVINTILLISPLDAEGRQIEDFTKIINSKEAKFKYRSGVQKSIDNSRVTLPDGETPIIARISIGG